MRHAICACATQKPAVLIGCGAASHAAADSQSARRATSPPQAGGLPHIGRAFRECPNQSRGFIRFRGRQAMPNTRRQSRSTPF